MLGLSLAIVAPAHAFDWSDLWSSAEQRAARQFKQQQYDELIDNAPDAYWRGLGEYRKGDYSAAAKSFEQLRGQAEGAGLVADAERAIYNQANAHVFEENYPAAISLFDELLESDPLHANAKHNREIALQLLDQQQQEQQQQSGEQGEQSDENQSESDGEEGEGDGEDQQQDQQSAENDQSDGDSSDQNDDQQQDGQPPEQASDNNGQGGDTEPDEASASAAEQQAEEDAAAEAAMQAERERQVDAPQDGQQTENPGDTEVAASVEPLSEREQANEQWLRQIPDDPAGLLERKIHNRHVTDFPKVIDSVQPW